MAPVGLKTPTNTLNATNKSRRVFYTQAADSRATANRGRRLVPWPIRARPQLGTDAPAIAETASSETYAASTLSRTLFSGAPSKQTLRQTLSQRPTVPGGSLGAVGVTLSVMLATKKLFWYLIVKRTKDCPDCRGYGIARCDLCRASGCVKWIGKWDHVEPCPECMGKRYHRCYTCGGLYHRPIFRHVKRNAGVDASQNRVLRTIDVVNPLVD